MAPQGLGQGFNNLSDFISMILQLNQQQGQFDAGQTLDRERIAEQGSQFATTVAEGGLDRTQRGEIAASRDEALNRQTGATEMRNTLQSIRDQGLQASPEAAAAFNDPSLSLFGTEQTGGLDAISNQPLPAAAGVGQLPDLEAISQELRQTQKNQLTQTAFTKAGETGIPQGIEGTDVRALPAPGQGGFRTALNRGPERELRLAQQGAELRLKGLDQAVDDFKTILSNPVVLGKIRSIMTSNLERGEAIAQARELAGSMLETRLDELNVSMNTIGQPEVDVGTFLDAIARDSETFDFAEPSQQEQIDGLRRFNAAQPPGEIPLTLEEYRQQGFPGLQAPGPINQGATGQEDLDAIDFRGLF